MEMEDRDGARSAARTDDRQGGQQSAKSDPDANGGVRDRGERERTTVRLSVNLGEQPAAALRELMSKKGITATEAVRRALSVWKFVEDELAQGNRLAVLVGEGDHRAVREIIFHD